MDVDLRLGTITKLNTERLSGGSQVCDRVFWDGRSRGAPPWGREGSAGLPESPQKAMWRKEAKMGALIREYLRLACPLWTSPEGNQPPEKARAVRKGQ